MGTRYTAQQFIKLIPGSGGIITTIAKRIGCEWHTAKKWIEKHPTVKQVYDDECEKVLDAAESVIVKAIVPGEDKEPDVQTAKWYLKMKGEERGYALTQKVEQKLEHSGTISIRAEDLTDDELAVIASRGGK